MVPCASGLVVVVPWRAFPRLAAPHAAHPQPTEFVALRCRGTLGCCGAWPADAHRCGCPLGIARRIAQTSLNLPSLAFCRRPSQGPLLRGAHSSARYARSEVSRNASQGSSRREERGAFGPADNCPRVAGSRQRSAGGACRLRVRSVSCGSWSCGSGGCRSSLSDLDATVLGPTSSALSVC